MAAVGELVLDVSVAADGWRDVAPDPAAIAERAARAAYRAGGREARTAEAAVRLTDDAEVRALNRDYRDRDRPTNVLSFPAFDADDIERLPADAPLMMGDVVVALETTVAEARSEGRLAENHLSHLVVHGMLHLLGFDHMEDTEAAIMERLETDILAGLGIADPYGREGPAIRAQNGAAGTS